MRAPEYAPTPGRSTLRRVTRRREIRAFTEHGKVRA